MLWSRFVTRSLLPGKRPSPRPRLWTINLLIIQSINFLTPPPLSPIKTKLDSAVDEEEKRISEESSARKKAEAEALDKLRADKLARMSAIGEENSSDPNKAEEQAGKEEEEEE